MAKLFGLFAFLFGLSYLAQGVPWLLRFASGATSRDFFWAQYQVAVIAADLFIGGGAVLAGAGMFFRREWGRKAWLAMLVLTLLLHLHLTVVQVLAGFDVSWLYVWIGMVVAVAALSWAYLTSATGRAHFR